MRQKKRGAATIFEVLHRIYDERLMDSFDKVYVRSQGLPPIIKAMATFKVYLPPAEAAADADKCGTAASDAASGACEAWHDGY